MLTDDELARWFSNLNLGPGAQKLIRGVRSEQPVRAVAGRRSNVSGKYPSRKMRVTIQFESHRVELAAIQEMEHDPDVLEYYEQPNRIPLSYLNRQGRKIRVLHTPDFLVLRAKTVGWEEWKTEADLESLSSKVPERYLHAERNLWRCPAGEAFATKLGMYYRLRSSKEINRVLQSNLDFLEDYLRWDSITEQSDRKDALRECVHAEPGILLNELLSKASGDAVADALYSMIARGELYADLNRCRLAETDRVRLFRDKQTADAFDRALDVTEAANNRTRPLECAVGRSLRWDGRIWKIVNVGDARVALLGEDQAFTELPFAALESLAREGRIQSVHTALPGEISSLLAQASQVELRTANRRCDLMRDFLRGGRDYETEVAGRTIRHWAAVYRRAEAVCGSGYIGLLPRLRQRGNRSSRLPLGVRTLMDQVIEQHYETPKQKTKRACWLALILECESKGLAAPSYHAFRRAIKTRSEYRLTLKRRGRRAAYQLQPFHWELDRKSPRHGDRPFEIAHIDHTQLDIETRCSSTGQLLGRPWMTLLTDAYSRRVLAVYLTFDEPSYRSSMMALRICVQRHARLPETIVVDNGKEFESTYFETLLARYECTKKRRPPAEARFGSVCERLFGTSNVQFIHNLQGNTQITRNVRQVTKSVDPRNLAVWTLADLDRRLSEFVYEIYDTMEHPALGQSPRDAFQSCLVRTGQRALRLIPYDQDFLMSTFPTTRKGTAKISAGRGVKIHGLYYWHGAFDQPAFARKQVPVRYDPFDAGTAYAYVGKRWVECCSELHWTFRGRSEKEIMLATEELRRRSKRFGQRYCLTRKRLAEFLQSVEAEEALHLQRLRDREMQAIRNPRPTGGPGHGEPPQQKRASELENPCELSMPRSA
jgi:putative transposase